MQLYSIEDESHCFLAIKKRLAARGLAHKVVQRFVPCELTELDELESHPYANAALSLPDDALALVLVAGKIRLSCLTAVLPKLAPGGLLALHQANRFLPNRYDGAFTTVHEPRTEPRSIAWADTGRALRSWRSLLTTDGIWDTRFWIKPTVRQPLSRAHQRQPAWVHVS
jgi:hypothetical protein